MSSTSTWSCLAQQVGNVEFWTLKREVKRVEREVLPRWCQRVLRLNMTCLRPRANISLTTVIVLSRNSLMTWTCFSLRYVPPWFCHVEELSWWCECVEHVSTGHSHPYPDYSHITKATGRIKPKQEELILFCFDSYRVQMFREWNFLQNEMKSVRQKGESTEKRTNMQRAQEEKNESQKKCWGINKGNTSLYANQIKYQGNNWQIYKEYGHIPLTTYQYHIPHTTYHLPLTNKLTKLLK